MRVLYHLRTSPFSRRARLALAFKGLAVELRDARQDVAWLDEARRLWPTGTFPVLVDTDGAVLGDSGAITHYLDRVYPASPLLWPAAPEHARIALEVAALTDVVLQVLVDLGTRYHRLGGDPSWAAATRPLVDRVQRCLSALARRVEPLGGNPLTAAGWSAPDIYLYTTVAWIESLAARASVSPALERIVALGFELPPALSVWAGRHRDRADVRAVEAMP